MLLCRLARRDLEESVYHRGADRNQQERSRTIVMPMLSLTFARSRTCWSLNAVPLWSLDPPLLLLLVRRGTGDPRPRLPK